MSKFKFMEIAIQQPSNRGYFLPTREAIRTPFKKQNRFKEYWRGMFAFASENPSEENPMFGNFYIESDEEDFQTNKNMILEVSDFLHSTYNIPYSYFDYFLTNRSIWLSVPTKVFGCYGTKKLNQIYHSMAEEVQQNLKTKGYSKGIDLSIYKWNGLIHSLGSYLHQSKRWVTKFTHNDLEESCTVEDLLTAEYDNFFTLDDVTVIDTASEWFMKHKANVFKFNHSVASFPCSSGIRPCMTKLEEKGMVDENRNLHIYSYALYLKEQGYNTQDAIDKIKDTFNMDYVLLRECKRTIKSAIEGNKRFNCKVVKELLSEDLFDCSSCPFGSMNKTTFIVPRLFIQQLHKARAHYQSYKFLIKILYSHQIKNETFTLNMKGEKYKSNIVGYFKKLEELDLITLSINEDILTANIMYKDKSIYKSHIVIPNEFVESKEFQLLGKEVKLLLELWRSSLRMNSKILYFNIKIATIAKNIGSSIMTVLKYLSELKSRKFVFGQQLFIENRKRNIRKLLLSLVKKVQKGKKKMTVVISKDRTSNKSSGEGETQLICNPLTFLSKNIKCLYSHLSKGLSKSLCEGVLMLF